MPRRTGTQLLRSEFDSRDGVGIVPVTTVANELNQLESQQSKVQASILVQYLMDLSALETKMVDNVTTMRERIMLIKRWLFIISGQMTISVVHVNSCSNHRAGGCLEI